MTDTASASAPATTKPTGQVIKSHVGARVVVTTLY